MKVGDLVKLNSPDKAFDNGSLLGLVTKIDDSHRQTTVTVMFSSGIIGPTWEKYLEVLNEAR